MEFCSFGVWSIACWDFFLGVTLFGMGWIVFVRGLGGLRPIDGFFLLHSTSIFTSLAGNNDTFSALILSRPVLEIPIWCRTNVAHHG